MGGGVAKYTTPVYEPVAQRDADEDGDGPSPSPALIASRHSGHGFPRRRRSCAIFALAFSLSLAVCLGLGLAMGDGTLFGIRNGVAAAGAGSCGLPSAPQKGVGGDDCPCRSETSKVPQYFQTSPELWAGPTATGRAPFLAQTRTFEGTYVPNAPLQTQVPIVGVGRGGDEGSIFEMMGFVITGLLIPLNRSH